MLLLTDFILVSGFAITVVLLLILLKAKRRQLPQNILIVFLGFIVITLANFYAGLHKLKYLYMFTTLFESGERFIFGPLILMYIKSLFIKDKNLVKNHQLHFIPFLLYWVVFTIPFVISDYQGRLIFDYLMTFNGEPHLALIKDTYLLIYIGLAINMFYRLKRFMKLNYSSYVTNNIVWLKKFLFSFFGLMLFDFLVTLYEAVFGYFISWDTGYVTAVVLILLVIYLGYNGIKQSIIAMPDFLLDAGFGKQKDTFLKISTDLSDEELNLLKDKLKEVIKNDKPYLSPELTLSNLAELVGTTNRKLSIVLNHGLCISFYDFINGHRIAAVKEKIESEAYDNFSILGIAYDAGFKSKSSFYRIFKKETGISPAEYKKNLSPKK